jgi:hypothetical protein
LTPSNGVAMLLAVVAGFGSQHNANEPGTAFAESPLIALLEPALDMYAAYFSPARPPGWTPWSDGPVVRRARGETGPWLDGGAGCR